MRSGVVHVSNPVITLALAAMLTACGPPTAAFGQTQLRWHFTPGETLEIEIRQGIQLDSKFGDEPIQVRNQMRQEMTWRVDSVDSEGTAQLTMRIDRLVMSLEIPGADSIEFDSANEEDAEGPAQRIAGDVRPLVGLECRLRVTPRGEVVSFKPTPQAEERLANMRPEMRWREIFSRQGIGTLVQLAVSPLPADAVVKGECWNATETVNSPVGPLQKETRYCYAGPNKEHGEKTARLEKINIQEQWTLAKEKNPSRVELQIKQQEGSGVLLVDAVAGRLVSGERSHKVTLRATIDGQAYLQQLTGWTKVSVKKMIND